MGYDVLVAVAAVVAVLIVRGGLHAFRVVRRLRRHVLVTLDRARRTDLAVTDPSWWANHRDRRRMWRSILNADRSVSAARAAGVPTGELSSVVRRLRAAGVALDAGFSGRCRSAALVRQADALATAADDVARAAADAVAADAAPVIAHAIDAARLELAALRPTH